MAERQRLENLTVKQLREEAQNLDLPTTGRKEDLIDALLSHSERDAFLRQNIPDVSGEVPEECQISGHRQENMPLQQFMKSVTEQLQQQQQMFLQLQQTVLQLSQSAQVSRVPEVMSQAIGNGQRTDRLPEERSRSVHSEASLEGGGALARSAVSVAPPANAVKLLALQIPEYGGTEEENVKLWFKEWTEWHRSTELQTTLRCWQRPAGSQAWQGNG